MPPRYTYWTIIVNNLPTAFRAARRDELLPTFAQLRARHPDAVMKWFARGRLWDSPEQAHAAWARPAPGDRRRAGATEKHGPEWRPGGAHRDPRERFKGVGKKKPDAGGRRPDAGRRPPETGGRDRRGAGTRRGPR